ncbi:ankyrin repeat-containing domain protein [Cercophora newfieldiana]|uniref:Ankyrin repeat-containing domain protein n=1 Tax=Cercophora newfieldiana TaxID=92897 RepID=A0AA40CQA5_9PEZI|nr:ankyrin repeat-containing domain protein [Cercophora newfieldiana]
MDQRLVELGADVNRERFNSKYGNAITQAAALGRLGWARFLLSHGASLGATGILSEFGSPLAAAVYHGNMDIARLFLSKGADASLKHHEGRFVSPLGAAASGGDIQCLQLILGYGPNVNMDGHAVGVTGTRIPTARGSALSEAVANGSLECLHALIDAGAEINQVLHSGVYGSALAAVARGGHLDCLVTLLRLGMDPNDGGTTGTGLGYAPIRDAADVMRALVKKGANVNQGTADEKRAPMHPLLAGERGRLSACYAFGRKHDTAQHGAGRECWNHGHPGKPRLIDAVLACGGDSASALEDSGDEGEDAFFDAVEFQKN